MSGEVYDRVELEQTEEIDLEKPRPENGIVGSQLFSVRYMRWSKKYIYPKAYIEKSLVDLNPKRYIIEFQIPGEHK